MRILCLPGGLPLDYTIQLANSLSKNENVTEVMIIITNDQGVEDHIENISQNVRFYLTRKIKFRLWFPLNIFISYEILKQIVDFNPDIIHIQTGGVFESFVLPFIKKYPLINTIHDPTLHLGETYNVVKHFIHKWTIDHSNKIIVHGERLRDDIVRRYNIPREEVHAIPMGEHNTAPFTKYMKKTVKDDGHTVLFFGRITPYKGLEYLIRAKPIITKEVPNAKLVIAGRSIGDDFEKYKKMMVNNNDFEVYNHYISWELGAELFQKASVVVLPYIEATQSGVIPVAYAFKKPVVVTNVGALPEIVDDEKTGFIVPPKDPEALAESIIKLLKSEKLRKDMGEAGYKKLKTDMSWDKISKMTIEIYKKVLKDKI